MTTTDPVLLACEAIQAKVLTFDGIKKAPIRPPEKMNVFPFSVCFPSDGTLDLQSYGFYKGLHNLYLEIHAARKDLPQEITTLVPYFDLLAKALSADPQLNGTVDTVSGNITYRFREMPWVGDVVHIGYRFIIPVKIIGED